MVSKIEIYQSSNIEKKIYNNYEKKNPSIFLDKTIWTEPVIPAPSLGVGSGPELEQKSLQNPSRRLVFLPVENRLIELNEEILFPFDLTVGESTPFGLYAFCRAEDIGDVYSGLLKRTEMETLSQHNRTALFGRILFSDKAGRVYRDIDLKGVGMFGKNLNHSNQTLHLPGGATGSGDVLGFAEKDWILHDYQVSEELLGLGVRTHRVVGIVEIDEYISDGQKKKLKGILKKRPEGMSRDYKPVIEIRAFGTRARIANASSDELVDDAKKIVSAELGRNTVMTDEEYIRWFAKNLGRSLGIMHANDWAHGFPTDHNITLDCRLTDFDGASYPATDEQKSMDFLVAEQALVWLHQKVEIRKESRKMKFYNDRYYNFGSSTTSREYEEAYNSVANLSRKAA